MQMSVTDKRLKAWLNYNCSQGNNWITLYKFSEIVAHGDVQYHETNSSGKPIKVPAISISPTSLRHIYFTYMTESLLITLVETVEGFLYLISNKLTINEDDVENDPNQKNPQQDTTKDSITATFTDDMIENYKTNDDNIVTKVETIAPLPQLQSIDSKIYKLTNIKHLQYCLTNKEMKLIGAPPKVWIKASLKKLQSDDLLKISFMDFINVKTDDEYIALFQKYIDQSANSSQSPGTLNLIHNYSITSDILSRCHSAKINQIIVYQNYQIDDFDWLKKYPNIKLVNLWYDHRIEQKHVQQICNILPDLEVFNIHYCCRVNIRILIPLLKLKHLQKLLIDDSYFWCQKSIHELFILPHEWKAIDCPSLQKVAINSKNLTLDVVDYIFSSCRGLQQILVDEDILKMVTRSIITGYNKDEPITFHSWQNPEKGFEIYKNVTFKNLFKDTYNSQLFSESMLKKIKENREKNNEPEQIAVGEVVPLPPEQLAPVQVETKEVLQ